jgi:hypothetical protein
MNSQEKLRQLLEAVESVNPQLVDYWQATAIIESLGYTDRIIKEEFGFPNARSLGQYIYEQHKPHFLPKLPPSPQSFRQKIFKELSIFIEQFSRSFVYAIPLILMLLLEYAGINAQEKAFSPQIASLLTLATLASLCTSGGFVQMISRRGEFYMGLGEPIHARRVCLPILYLGIASSIILCSIGLWFGFYRSLFADEYLILAAIYYLLLSVLWILIAILAVLFSRAEAFVLVGYSLLFIFLKVYLGMSAIAAQILVTAITLIAIIICITIGFQQGKASSDGSTEVELPRLSALVYLLSPYFFYGISYFGFIFSDRFIAGWAVDPASGLIFAIDSDYQKEMNLALLNFLVLVPWVEYVSYKFIRYWYDRAKKLTSLQLPIFTHQLQYRYGLALIVIGLFFLLTVSLTLSNFLPFNRELQTNSLMILGCVGYLFFAIGLFNGILLFSLNRATVALKTIFPSLMLNFIFGYLLTHLLDIRGAAIGLTVGAIAFAILSGLQILQAIKHPDYAYYLGGY